MCDRPDSLHEKIAKGIDFLTHQLVASMYPSGYWEGGLSSSALSTATAISAMSSANLEIDRPRIQNGVLWLLNYANPEGGWGDTADSPSNLATTLLVLAALKLSKADDSRLDPIRQKAAEYLKLQGVDLEKDVSQAIQREYGADRTFAVPILMNCALAGLVDWADIPGLPFELAIFPHRFYKALRLHVVSYAMPALIAIGLLLNAKNPPRNFFKHWIRRSVVSKVLKILRNMQPPSGGFLEAIPLTSFVTMGLLPLFGPAEPVAADCLAFLRNVQREDGSWPIDSNLSAWVTTSAVVALSEAKSLTKVDARRTSQWIAERQYAAPHPFTHAAPGGWAWTHLAGGVPDADDTSGAILALAELHSSSDNPAKNLVQQEKGIRWLFDLQNNDGGWPTFCRGWGKLPFDRSSPDITAHVLRAIEKFRSSASSSKIQSTCAAAIRKGLRYLSRTQQPDGAWLPLWYGNQAAPDRTNPVIGTSLVLRALELLQFDSESAVRGVQYLLQSQNSDGGWGGASQVRSTAEETALALSALAAWGHEPQIGGAIRRGLGYLLGQLGDAVKNPQPIGLYFSHLWYAEKLYPTVWSLEALGRVQSKPPAEFDSRGEK
jgi:squalene-hopene/tetraprenyl-beta-curcumene cyclase